MPKHVHNVHAVLENLHVTDVADLLTPLLVIKENLLISHVLGHFGKVLKFSNQCLWSHVIWIYQSQVMVFYLKCIFVDF